MVAIDIARILTELDNGRTAAELESQTLEFKQDKRLPEDTERDIAEAAVCLANGAGGTIVLGVADRRTGPEAFVGTALAIDRLRQSVYASTQPGLLVEVQDLIHQGVRLLVVRVPEGVDVYADSKGRPYRRIGNQCQPMPVAEATRLREERLGHDWSAEASARVPGDVSAATLETVRSVLSALPDDRRGLVALSDLDLLRALDLLAGEQLNRAGALLLLPAEAERPRLVYQFRPTPGGEPTFSERLEGPLVAAFARVMEVVRTRVNSAPLNLPDGQQIQLQDFPELAVREAIANGLVHRDYRLPGAVAIEHSPAVFAVTSPGPLVAGVTPENILTHPPKPRNRTLANAARKLGFAEEFGRGIDRIYISLIRAGRGLPVIENDPGQVAIRMVGGAPNVHIARYVASLPTVERDDTDALLVLYRLCSTRVVTPQTIAPLLQRSEAEAAAILGRLAVDPPAMVERTRPARAGAGPAYKLTGPALAALGPAVTYQVRSISDTDRKVVAHVAEYGKITNRTVQNLFDVTVHPANAIIDDLVRREILIKTSVQQRGPGVEYGPGSKFPHRGRASRRREGSKADSATLWDEQEP
jgi:ATP-dependent DNA helicase RecG